MCVRCDHQMSWPVSEGGGMHSLLMLEARSGSLGWLVTSTPGTNVSAGLTLMDYTQHQPDTDHGEGGEVVIVSLLIPFRRGSSESHHGV